MNLRRRLLRFHPPALRNAPKSSVWSSHLPPPFRTLRFHPPDRSATAETNEALGVSVRFLIRRFQRKLLEGRTVCTVLKIQNTLEPYNPSINDADLSELYCSHLLSYSFCKRALPECVPNNSKPNDSNFTNYDWTFSQVIRDIYFNQYSQWIAMISSVSVLQQFLDH
ncbi:hypothetical protein KSP40_PGU022786 [Platanthera guangdongensis]|uniref:Uncharacterized protein n=1 Tax=Platanthera guangdongensis TaxID=2320717 RepID=A0ABR2LPF7_9ASPA